jgi:hypothetical protein
MKNKQILMRILANVLVFGLVFVGCKQPTDSEENNMTKFEGTWRNPNGNHPAYTFINDTYKITNYEGFLAQGTFSFDDTTITFIPAEGESWTQEYTLNGNDLIITYLDDGHNYGQFIKNWERQETRFEGEWKSGTRTFAFSFNHFEFSDNSQNFSKTGNFTFTDTTITFIPTDGSNSWTQDYTLQNDTLNLQQPQGGGYGWEIFTKQSE